MVVSRLIQPVIGTPIGTVITDWIDLKRAAPEFRIVVLIVHASP